MKAISLKAFVVLFAVAGSSLAFWTGPKHRTEDKKNELSSLAWMSGSWCDKQANGDQLEELWGEPSNNSLVGSFRWMLADGKIRVLEILAIAKEGDDVVLRLRHFDDKLVAREKDPMVLKRTASEEKSATFSGEDGANKTTIKYWREDDTTLKAKLELVRDGKSRSLSFNFKKRS